MIYFDNAATTWPKPFGVRREILKTMTAAGGNPGRSSHILSLAAAEKIDSVRCAVGDLIGAPDPSHIIFTLNATDALNLAIKTRVRQGMHILISDREHNAVYRPVCRLLRDGIADFDIFSTRGDVLENIRRLLRPESGMLICNHVSNVDGAVAPVKKIARFCRERGLYCIIDASQSIGHIPLTLSECPCDALCAPGHKGLYGIQGAGFVWLRDGKDRTEYREGGSGSASRLPTMPNDLPDRMEAGTPPTPAIAAMGAGIAFLCERGIEEIAAHEAALAAHLIDCLSDIRGIQCYHGGGGVCSFVAAIPPNHLTNALDRYNICVRGGLHCAPLAHAAIGTEESGTVRVSFGAFNTLREVEKFSSVLREIVKEAEATSV